MVRPARFAITAVVLIGLVGPLAACAGGDFDFDKLDVFGISEKKKLPGERRALFPEGVPGVTQGVPPELVKGNRPQQPAETAATEPAKPPEPAKPKPEAKPKAKPRVAAKPTRLTVSPQQKQQQPEQTQQPAQAQPTQQTQPQQQSGVNAPWPSTTAQQPSPWPSAPPPGTFQR